MELLPVTLSANETKRFEKGGRYFEIIDSAFPVGVDFYGPNGNQTDVMNNALSGLYIADPYTSFVVRNGPTAQTVTLLVMETGNGGSRRQPGIVQVMDMSIARTMQLNQFWGNATINANATNCCNASLYANNSIKKIAIRRMMLTSTVGGVVALAPFTGAGTAVVSSGGGTGKASSSFASDARLCTGLSATASPSGAEIPGLLGGMRVSIAAGVTFEFRWDTPMVLTGTMGLNVCGLAANRDLTIGFDWEEVN